MKILKSNWYLGLLLLFGSLILNSQQSSELKSKPQKIGGIAKENKPLSYYQEQSGLWQQLIELDPKNEEAWLNYYLAERAALQLAEPLMWSDDKDAFYSRLDPLIAGSKKHIQHKFEYPYLNGLNSRGENSITSLKQAYELDPERSEVYGWLIVHYIENFDHENCIDLSKKMLKSNIYSDANLKWNYNALASVEDNALVISNGDMDGGPKWVLQYGQNFRPDVFIINKWLLSTLPNYRKEVYKRLELKAAPKTESDFENMTDYTDYLTADLLLRSKRPSYISVGTYKSFFKKYNIQDKMYLVGNVLRYSNREFNNIEVLRDNIENKYFLEYLFKNFQQHHEDEMVKTHMNLTYLPGMMLLRDHYVSEGLDKEKLKMDELIAKIASDSGKGDRVLKWFGQD